MQVRNEQLQQLELSETAAEQAQEEAESQLERVQQVADTEAKTRKDLEYCLHEEDQELINQQLQLRDAQTAIEAVEQHVTDVVVQLRKTGLQSPRLKLNSIVKCM